MSKGQNQQRSQNGDIGILKGLVLLSLPILRFQQAILPNVRSGLEKDTDEIVKAVEHFVAFELHALMMLMDPSGRLRAQLDESELKKHIKPVLDSVAAGTISFVKAQEEILQASITLLDGIRNGEQAKGK